mgnify:CR=1 FL=1
MGGLYLVGIGLGEKGISVKGLEIARKSDMVLLDSYTNVIDENKVKTLSGLIGKEVRLADRTSLEENIDPLIEESKKKRICILVPGDPLLGTTHISIVVRARELGVKCEVIPGASIFSSIGLTGLSPYKFGRTVTIPHLEKSFKPRSFYYQIKLNKDVGLHTLVLLDTERGGMSPSVAVTILDEIENEERLGVVSNSDLIFVLSRIGEENQHICLDRLESVISKEFGPPPHSLVLPGKIDEVEREMIKALFGVEV